MDYVFSNRDFSIEPDTTFDSYLQGPVPLNFTEETPGTGEVECNTKLNVPGTL